MKFNLINQNDWKRKPYFDYYLAQETTFSITSEIDITPLYFHLKSHKFKFYPALLYMLTKVVNNHDEYRTCFNEDVELGYWSSMVASYTIFNEKSKTFASIWTEHSECFRTFHQKVIEDIRAYEGKEELFPKKPIPPNSFPVSMIPWVSFTGFNLNIMNHGNYLLPIFTAGKFIRKESRIFLPVSLQMHHAVCDGYHASQYINELQKLADEYMKWI